MQFRQIRSGIENFGENFSPFLDLGTISRDMAKKVYIISKKLFQNLEMFKKVCYKTFKIYRFAGIYQNLKINKFQIFKILRFSGSFKKLLKFSKIFDKIFKFLRNYYIFQSSLYFLSFLDLKKIFRFSKFRDFHEVLKIFKSINFQTLKISQFRNFPKIYIWMIFE